jgi:hypothetical protein
MCPTLHLGYSMPMRGYPAQYRRMTIFGVVAAMLPIPSLPASGQNVLG